MLHLEGQSQELFSEAIAALKAGRGSAPQNALDVSRLESFVTIGKAANLRFVDSQGVSFLCVVEEICPSKLGDNCRTGWIGPNRSHLHRLCEQPGYCNSRRRRLYVLSLWRFGGAKELTITLVHKRHKAIGVLLAITAGAYQTTLLTYMIQRDLFPSVIKVPSRIVSCTRHALLI